MGLNVFLHDNNSRKINRAIGKYLTVRTCFDFILLVVNKGNNVINLDKAENEIINGLLYLTKSILGNKQILSINEYINSDEYFYTELQIAYARNFTILYGVGSFSENSEMMNKYKKY